MRLLICTLCTFLWLAPAAASAQAGDAAAVLQHCGAPDHEHQGISLVTNKMERDLTYGNVILHFLPQENGWRFLSGWSSHIPLTRSMVENRMPCFREAMASSPRDPAEQSQIDPSIRSQITQQPDGAFGIAHLRLILLLAILVVLSYFLLPGRYRRVPRPTAVESIRRRRRPSVESEAGN